MASKANQEQNRNHRAAPCRSTLRPIVFALMAAFGSTAHGLPSDPKLIAGQATVSTSNPSSMVINQSSSKAAIDWRTFNVAGQESVSFAQPSASAMTVNRVTSNDPSQILGRISAPGSVFLINPAGVMFGKSAVVHVGNLVASTLNANPHDLLAGRLVLTADAAGAGIVRNDGEISTPAGGSVSLIGARVINTGHISTPGGTTGLIAGDKVALDFDGDGLVRYQVDGAMARAIVEHSGRIDADGGRVVMQARARDALLDTVLNVEGVVRARGVAMRNGEIHLDGGGSGVVSVSGQLDASTPGVARQGGEIRVLGERVGLFGQAQLDASGAAGGGTVLIGGNYQGQGSEHNATQTYVASGVRIAADAGTTGDGGRVIVWADDWTRYHGTTSARGGEQGGDGGFVEVSGKRNLTFDGDVVTSAAKGKVGMLLLDPGDLTFSSAAVGGATQLTTNPFLTSTSTNFYVLNSSVTPDNSYTLQANSDFILNTNASFGSTAGRTVSITAGTSIRSTCSPNCSISTAGADLNLKAASMVLGDVSTGSISTGFGALKIDVTGSATQTGAFTGGSLTKLGTGTLLLSQANTFTSGTTVSAGILTAKHNIALGTGPVAVANNATLDLDAVTLAAGPLTLAGTGAGAIGALTLTAPPTASATYAGQVILNSSVVSIGVAGGVSGVDTLTLSGQITGTGHLTKVGTGTLLLNNPPGSPNNNYSGGTTVSAGILTAASNSALGTGQVDVLIGGTLDLGTGVTLATGPLTLAGTGAGAIGALTLTAPPTAPPNPPTAATYAGQVILNSSVVSPVVSIGVRAGDTLTLSGQITGTGPLIKGGLGTLLLNNPLGSPNNNYSGGTTVSAGILTAASNNALGSGQVDVLSGGTLDLGTGVALAAGPLTLAGTGAGGIGALTLTAPPSASASYAGQVILNSSVVSIGVRAGDTLTLSGQITGTGPLIKGELGTLELGNSGNAYSGGTTVDGGTLRTSVSNVIPNSGAVTVNSGATLDLNGNTETIGTLTGQTSSTLALGSAGQLITDTTSAGGTFSGQITGGGSSRFTKQGANPLTLDGNSNSYSGTTTVGQGILRAGSNNALGGGQVDVRSGGTLEIGAGVTTLPAGPLFLAGTGAGGNGALTGSGTLTYLRPVYFNTPGNSTVNSTGASIVWASGTLTLAGLITDAVTGTVSGTGPLIKGGRGTLELTNPGGNTYSGGTTVSQGILRAGSNNALGSGQVDVRSGGTLEIGAGVTLPAGPLILAGTGGVGNGALTGSGTLTYAGPVRLNNLVNSTGASIVWASGTLTLAGLITDAATGTGPLIKGGLGTLELGNTGNTYSGGTTVSAGTLRTSVSNVIPNSGAVTLNPGATLDLNGNTETIGPLIGQQALPGQTSSTLALGPAGQLITDTTSAGGTFSGQITGGVNSRFTKQGANPLTLDGNSSGYSGTTTVSTGILNAAHNNALGSGQVDVVSGATLDIGAGVTLAAGPLNLAGTGAVDPLTNVPIGALTLTANTGTATYAGSVSVNNAGASIGVWGTSDTLTLSGPISGGPLTKVGTQTLVLNNANTYSGGTTVGQGILRAGSNNALGSGQVDVRSGGTLDIGAGVTLPAGPLILAGTGGVGNGALTGSGTLTYAGPVRLNNLVNSTGTSIVWASGTLTLAGPITDAATGTGPLIKGGLGTLELGNTGNAYSGGTTVDGGRLRTLTSEVIPNSGAVTLNPGATLDLNGNTETIGPLIGRQALPGQASSTLALGSAAQLVTDTTSAGGTFSGQITGVGGSGFTKQGANTLTLDGNSNSYSGTTTVGQGILRAGSNNALGGGQVDVRSGGTLDIGAGVTLAAGPLNLAGTGVGGNGALTLTAPPSATATYPGQVILNSPVVSIGVGASDTLTLSGPIADAITGSGQLTKVGAGTLELGNSGNAYSGGTTVDGGRLRTMASNVIPNSGAVTLNPGATLDLNGNTETIGPLIGQQALPGQTSSTLALGLAGQLITDTTSAGTFSGQITGGSGSRFTKQGASTLTVDGNSSAYSGTTTVSTGILTAAHNNALGSGPVDVPGGATLDIGAGVTLAAGPLTLAGTGALVPGTGPIGALTLTAPPTATATYGGSVSLNNAGASIGVWGSNDTLTLSGPISGGPLTKVGTQTLELGNTSNTYSGGTTVDGGRLRTMASNVIPNSGAVTLNPGATLDLNGNTETIGPLIGQQALPGQTSSTLALGPAGQLITDTTSAGGTFSGQITGGVNSRFTKQGANPLTLDGNSSGYSGTTTVSTGILNAAHNNALGGGQVDVRSGGTLEIGAGVTLAAGPLNLVGTGVGGNGALIGSGTVTYAGPVNLNGPGASIGVGASDTLTLSGPIADAITGSGQLTKVGAGTLELGNTSNAYSGGTTVDGGRLRTLSSEVIPNSGAVTLNPGATLDLNGNTETIGPLIGQQALPGQTSSTLALGPAGQLITDTTSAGGTFSGQITGGGGSGFTKQGANPLTLDGNSSGYSGTTTVSTGILNAAHNNALGSGPVDVPSGATLDIGAGVTLAAGPLNLAGTGVGGNGALTLTAGPSASASYAGQVILNSPVVSIGVGVSDTLTLSGPIADAITGSGQLTKVGAGTLELGNTSNAYSGGTTVDGGRLRTMVSNVIPNSGAVTLNPGATLDLNGNTETIGPLIGRQALPGQASSTLALGSAAQLVTDTTSAGGTFSGQITGVGGSGFTKQGANPLTLDGNSSGYSGTTTVSTGILNAAHNNALGSGPVDVPSGATLDIGAGVTLAAGPLTLAGTGVGGNGALTLTAGPSASASYAGQVILNSPVVSIGVGASDTLTLSGPIADAITGSGQLTKVGAGTLELGNTSNAYSGGTTVDGGRLRTLSSEVIPNSGAVTLNPGATLDLNGNTETIGPLIGQQALPGQTSSTLALGPAGQLITDTTSAGGTFSGQITGGVNSRFTKQGANPLTLDGNSSGYSGTTTVSTGILNAAHNNALGRGQVDVLSGTTLNIDHVSLLAGGLRLAGTLSGTGLAGYSGGQMTLAGSASIDLPQPGDTLTVSSPLSGGGNDLTIGGQGTLALAADVSGVRHLAQQATGTLDLGTTVRTIATSGRQSYLGVVRGATVTLTSTAGDIEVTNAGNDFTRRLTVSGRAATLTDANALDLSATLTGQLTTTSQSLLLGPTAVGGPVVLSVMGGDVTQNGDVRISGPTTISAGGGDVTLDRAGNDFTGRLTVGAYNATLADANALDLSATLTGKLTTSSQSLLFGPTTVGGPVVLSVLGGDVTQTGDVRISGPTAISAGGGDVTLDRAGNDFTGRLTVGAYNAKLADANALDLSATLTGKLTTTSQSLLLGPTTIDSTAQVTTTGPVTQDGDLRITGATRIDAAAQRVTLDRPGNDFLGAVSVTAGETGLRDRNGLTVSLNTGNTQLTAGELTVEGRVQSTGSSFWSSDTTIDLGNLSVTGAGLLRLEANRDRVAMPTEEVHHVSVQDATGNPKNLGLYRPAIFQKAGATIATDRDVTLGLQTGKGSVDLTAGATVAGKAAGLATLFEAFSVPTDGQQIAHPGGATNRLEGPVHALTGTDQLQTGENKSVVAIASDTIRVASSPTPAVNADSVMLLGRVIEGGGGNIQTWVAATQRRGGTNIATDPAGVNDNAFSILPSIFLIADSPSGGGSFRYGLESSPIAVSFGGTGTVGNSTLQTIAPYQFRKSGSVAGLAPIYLSTINSGGVGPNGIVSIALARPADIALSDVRTVVVDGRMVVDTSAYQAIQSANAAILNQMRIEQFESGFSNENVAAQLRKGVITETGVGQAAVDKFVGVAGAAACDGTVTGGTMTCVSAQDAGK